jgi:S-formylglutathione hydrolase
LSFRILLFSLISAAAAVRAADLVLAETTSPLVPKPVPYAVLLPDGFKESTGTLPFEELWKSKRLSPMIVTMPSTTQRGFYMNTKDGTEKWEDFLTGPYRELMQKTYRASANPKENFLSGISMGGMGTLRIGFKHPEMFGGIAALEAGIEPILHWKDMRPRDRWWRADDLFEAAFGKPVDPAYWEANNPASIAQANPQKLIRSGMQIYIDAADHDLFFLYEGNEFLHRILYDNHVEHEYHLVHGADHVGRTVSIRFRDAMDFIERTLHPPGPDPVVETARKQFKPLKTRLGIIDPYDPKL